MNKIFLLLLIFASSLRSAEIARTVVMSMNEDQVKSIQISGQAGDGFVLSISDVSGTAGVVVQGSVDGISWTSIPSSIVGGPRSLTLTAAGMYVGSAKGYVSLRALVVRARLGLGSLRCALLWRKSS